MYTDEQILSMNNITPKIAAEYLGMTANSVIYSLRCDAENKTSHLPIGYATRSLNDVSWRYIIVPQKLVAYKNGTGREDIDRLLSGVKQSLDQVVEYLKLALKTQAS